MTFYVFLANLYTLEFVATSIEGRKPGCFFLYPIMWAICKGKSLLTANIGFQYWPLN